MQPRVFVLVNGDVRARAATYLQREAPDGWTVHVRPPRRDSLINGALHARLGEIADRVEWAGRKWDIEAWKRLFVAAWSRSTDRDAEAAPALDGQGVDVVFRQTSQMTQREMAELLAYIDAWCAERPEFQDSG